MVTTKCGTAKVPYLLVEVDRRTDSDVKQRRADLRRCTEEIVPNIKKKLNCPGSTGR